MCRNYGTPLAFLHPQLEISGCASTEPLSHIYDFFLNVSLSMVYAHGALTDHKVIRARCSAHGLDLWTARLFLTANQMHREQLQSNALFGLFSKCSIVKPNLHSYLRGPLQRSQL